METRKEREKEFHNFVRGEKLKSSEEFEFFTANEIFYSVVRKSKTFVDRWLIDKVPNKKVLDWCCGNGFKSLKIAGMGPAEVVGIDISDVSIENAKRYAQKEKLDRPVHFYVMDAENMEFEDDSFDIVFESGVLHHLELERAYSELARVLRTDGEVICIEALGHNPIIQLYRKITPHLRTEWETKHILRKKDIELAKDYFGKAEIIGFFHLSVLVAIPFRNTVLFTPLLKVMEELDKVLLKLPVLKWQAWQAIFLLSQPRKPGKGAMGRQKKW